MREGSNSLSNEAWVCASDTSACIFTSMKKRGTCPCFRKWQLHSNRQELLGKKFYCVFKHIIEYHVTIWIFIHNNDPKHAAQIET